MASNGMAFAQHRWRGLSLCCCTKRPAACIHYRDSARWDLHFAEIRPGSRRMSSALRKRRANRVTYSFVELVIYINRSVRTALNLIETLSRLCNTNMFPFYPAQLPTFRKIMMMVMRIDPCLSITSMLLLTTDGEHRAHRAFFNVHVP